MNKTHRDEWRRLFLLERLPEPLTRADRHLQIFDNYIAQTRIRLRTVREPETKERRWILQQHFAADAARAHRKIAEIYLNEAEYQVFKPFEGREIRFNRYFYETNGKTIELDVFLGGLSGLILARVHFESAEEMRNYAFPFEAPEVTNDLLFEGAALVGKSYPEVRAHVAAPAKKK